MHNELLLEHFRNPRNVGQLDPPALIIDVSNPACGDTLRLSVEVSAGAIIRALYKVRGCTAAIAAGSVLTQMLEGISVADLASLSAIAIDERLGGLPSESKHAAALCEDAAKALLEVIALEAPPDVK